MTIASINSVPEGSIASFNGVSKAAIGSIDGQSFPVDSISLSAGSIFYDTFGVAYADNFVIVTSSATWTAAIQDWHSATIRVTRGTVYEDLVIYQDGTVLTCS